MRGIVSCELKTSSLSGRRIPLLYRIFQSSGRAHDGNSSVAHAVNLSKSARFIMGGHEKDVRPGFDHVGQAVVIGDLYRDAIRIDIVQRTEHLFKPPLPGAQNN